MSKEPKKEPMETPYGVYKRLFPVKKVEEKAKVPEEPK
jgi:hypothetical protein